MLNADYPLVVKAGFQKVPRSLTNYIDLFYSHFPIDKLQSADITALNPCINTTFTDKEISLGPHGTSNSNGLNLDNLECQINRLLNSIQDLHKGREKTHQHDTLCWMLSQHMMEIIVKEITNNVESEELDKEQPLKLRVFSNLSERISKGEVYEAGVEWFRRKMRG